MSQNVSVKINMEFQVIDCASCGVSFAITSDYMKWRREDHKTFYCPSGHSNVYLSESKTEKLERKLKFEINRRKGAEKETKYQLEETEKQKTVNTKLKHRVKHGVCPCCNRTFMQLSKHMKNKHPEYAETK